MSRAFTRTWTAHQEALLPQLVKEGLRTPEIRARLGASSDQAVRCKAARLGITLPCAGRRRPCPPKPKAAAPDVLQMVREAIARDPAGAAPMPHSAKAWPIHLAAYVVHVELGFSQRAVAAVVGRDPKLVTYAVRRLEERRDEDPAFDAFLERLGDQARELAA